MSVISIQVVVEMLRVDKFTLEELSELRRAVYWWADNRHLGTQYVTGG